MKKNLHLKQIIILLGILFITANCYSQQVNSKKNNYYSDTIYYKAYKNYAGFNAGFTTGVGFSYRHLFNKFGAQLTIGPYYANYGDNVTLSCGLAILYRISKPSIATCYVYLGNHYYYEYDHYYGSNVTNSGLNTGLGLCLDGRVSEHFSVNCMAGYASYLCLNQSYPLKKLNITGEIGFFYLF
jgi:hypothetical protein